MKYKVVEGHMAYMVMYISTGSKRAYWNGTTVLVQAKADAINMTFYADARVDDVLKECKVVRIEGTK